MDYHKFFSFPIEDFTGKDVCMHCSTEEEANAFLEFLHGIGRRWASGDSYLSHNNFGDCGSGTCYYFNQGLYGGFSNATARNRTVLEFSDYLIDEEEPEIDDAPLNEFFSSFSLCG